MRKKLTAVVAALFLSMLFMPAAIARTEAVQPNNGQATADAGAATLSYSLADGQMMVRFDSNQICFTLQGDGGALTHWRVKRDPVEPQPGWAHIMPYAISLATVENLASELETKNGLTVLQIDCDQLGEDGMKLLHHPPL